MTGLAVVRDFAASPEVVFDAWLDPAVARRFLFATSAGTMLTCAIDARVGGEALIVEQRGAQDTHHWLRFDEIDRPRRLIFRFRAGLAGERDDGEWTRVAIDIAPTGHGARLTLTHDGVWPDYEDRTRQGWTMILGNLANTVEKTDD